MAESLLQLHPDILSEILSRLPIKTICVCRSVCKTFLHLTTSNSHLFSLHTSNIAQFLAIQFGLPQASPRSIHVLDSLIDTSFRIGESVKLKTMCRTPRFSTNYFKNNCYPVRGQLDLVSSCNGLLFFAESEMFDGSFVCNPITREYVTIPKHDRQHRTMGYWFGFSPEENLYKVLRISFTVKGRCWELDPIQDQWAQVYTLGSSSWRPLEEKPQSDYISWESSPAIVNGTVCWLCRHTDSSRYIMFFDFHMEKFGKILAPVCFGRPSERHEWSMSIGVLGGNLCMTGDTNSYDIWVMKEFDCRESWTKKFSIDKLSVFGLWPDRMLRPLQILVDGKLLMLWNNRVLVKYDPETKDFRFLEFNGVRSIYEVVIYTPTFAHLKDIFMVDNLTVQNMSRSVERKDPILIKDSHDELGNAWWSLFYFS